MGERTNDTNAYNNGQKNPRQKQKNPLNTEPTDRNTKEPHQLTNPTQEQKPEQKPNAGTENIEFQADANFDLEWDSDFDPSLRED
jgi:hypothetical protein